MTREYKYSNGVVLPDPWRFTPNPVWGNDSNTHSRWHRWVPAKIEWRGIEDAYYRGEQ